jgi:hypothetical protein
MARNNLTANSVINIIKACNDNNVKYLKLHELELNFGGAIEAPILHEAEQATEEQPESTSEIHSITEEGKVSDVDLMNFTDPSRFIKNLEEGEIALADDTGIGEDV